MQASGQHRAISIHADIYRSTSKAARTTRDAEAKGTNATLINKLDQFPQVGGSSAVERVKMSIHGKTTNCTYMVLLNPPA
jgi:hypothetical protein